MNNQTLELLRSLLTTFKSIDSVISIIVILVQIQNIRHYDNKPDMHNISILFILNIMLALFNFIIAVIQVPLDAYSSTPFIYTFIFLTVAFINLGLVDNIRNSNNNRNDTNTDDDNSNK